MGSGFVNADLTGVEFLRGNFDYCCFQDCDLRGMDLSDISFRNADFRKALLEKCVIHDADFTKAMLSNARLTDADLRGSVLDGVYLKDVFWRKTKIDIQQAALLAECMGAIVE